MACLSWNSMERTGRFPGRLPEVRRKAPKLSEAFGLFCRYLAAGRRV